MIYRSKHRGSHVSGPVALITGTGISLGIILLGSSVLALMTHREMIGSDKIGYGVMILLIAATFLGCKTACGKTDEKRMLISALSAMVEFMVLVGMNILFFGGRFSGVGETLLLLLCGGGLAALPRKEGRRQVKTHRMKRMAR